MPADGWYFADSYYGQRYVMSYVTNLRSMWKDTDTRPPYMRAWVRDALFLRNKSRRRTLRINHGYLNSLWQASQQRSQERFITVMSKFFGITGAYICPRCLQFRLDSYGVLHVGNHGDMCRDCRDNHFFQCPLCENWEHYNQGCNTGNRTLCQDCVEDEHTYCDRCNIWHRSETGCPREGCKCKPHGLEFTFPNQGGVITQDERTTIKLPAGMISQDGVNMMIERLRYYFPDAPWRVINEIGEEWVTNEGTFPKRLARAMYKYNGYKASETLMTQIGNLASDHSSKEAAVRISLTRDLNLSAKEFYHRDSCWWGSYANSRCSLKTLHGIGLRTWHGSIVRGRAWIMCFDENMNPTEDTNAHAYMVFNGYGNLGGYAPARIVAYMTGKSYRKVQFYCPPMYVNSNVGYIIADEEAIKKYVRGTIQVKSVERDQHKKAEVRTLVLANQF